MRLRQTDATKMNFLCCATNKYYNYCFISDEFKHLDSFANSHFVSPDPWDQSSFFDLCRASEHVATKFILKREKSV